MPSLLVVVVVDGGPDAGPGLESGGMREQHLAPARTERFGGRDQRRHQRRGNVTAHEIGRVVKIKRVRGGAVDERGIESTCAPAGSEYQARATARVQSEHVPETSR